jgi:hypothetical protein
VKLRDAFAQASEALNEYIDTFAPVDQEDYNAEQITWIPTEGARGIYEKSEDYNNIHHQKLLKHIAANNGKLTQNGKFYWTFQNGATIGRK